MRLPRPKPVTDRRSHFAPLAIRALTTTELIVTMAIFSMVMMGAIQLHLFGLRQNEIVEARLGASDQARGMFAWMVEEIRGAKRWQIGDGSETEFTPVANGLAQQGSALQLYPTTDTNVFIRYYFDPDEKALRRTQSGVDDSRLIAAHLTNSVFFTAEDHRGNIKTNLTYKSAIGIRFEFFQYQYPTTVVGEGYLFNYYKLEYKVTPHSPDGA
ncbi:MAG TPA: hypothetical protein PKA41_12585 [Verrucomicrobiota bacterium]|nr:hypothetical protein [Verrucomicrobiota bacterium]